MVDIQMLERRFAFVCARNVLIVLAAALALWRAPAAAQAPAASAQVRAEYTLGAGDRVSVTVFRHQDLSGEFDVDGAGRVTLPLIGQMDVLGMTAPEVEAAVTARLKPDYLKNPRVSVQVLTYRPFYIIGEVNQPGSYAYVSGLTVVQAVALAGGFTYRAKPNQVLIQRANDPSRAKRRIGQTDPVLPGDIIEVPERFF